MSKVLKESISSSKELKHVECVEAFNELTLIVDAKDLHATLTLLKEDKHFRFDVLVDLCGVDYSVYGEEEWETEEATFKGFSRGREMDVMAEPKPVKLAVVYHLLSTVLNHRLRVKVFCDEMIPVVPTAIDIWPTANWYEREAYDLYGVLFEGHPDLRRILTDYGFIGHPFRKDFPISGHVEMRYDAKTARVIYEPVDIEPRTLVPRVIRHDNRYSTHESND